MIPSPQCPHCGSGAIFRAPLRGIKNAFIPFGASPVELWSWKTDKKGMLRFLCKGCGIHRLVKKEKVKETFYAHVPKDSLEEKVIDVLLRD